MIEEGSLYLGDDRRIATLPKPLRKKLKADGWEDGGIIWEYDERSKTLIMFQRCRVLAEAVKLAKKNVESSLRNNENAEGGFRSVEIIRNGRIHQFSY